MRTLRAFDAALIRATRAITVAIGAAFTLFLCIGIVGRYLASFSVSFVEAGARFLLVWFFLLGAGLALREGAHVGLDLLRQMAPARIARFIDLAAGLCVLAFCALVLAGTGGAMATSASMVEPTLGISSAWGMAAVPVGIALLVYHQVVMLIGAWSRQASS
jgi:C4-dicarboxylate transporter DctQ subunit